MDNLRLILILCGVLFIVGIYLWGYHAQKRKAKQRTSDKARKGIAKPLASTSSTKYSPQKREKFKDMAAQERRLTLGELALISESAHDIPSPPEKIPQIGGKAGVQKAPAAPESIVQLTVVAAEEQYFTGEQIQDAMEKVGLRFGDMQIFHHYGLEEGSTRPVFSAADIFEPGFFDPNTLDDHSTRGLILFMRLPGPLDGTVAFELMLNAGQRLAELLGGELRDERRTPLSPPAIARIRERVAEFTAT